MMAKIGNHDTQWAAQTAVAYELARRAYRFAFSHGSEPGVDLRVTSPGGQPLHVQVKGQQGPAHRRSGSDFFVRYPGDPDAEMLYFFVAVPTDEVAGTCTARMFIMTAAEVAKAQDEYLADRRRRGTPDDRWKPGIRWKDATAHENAWSKLPA